MVLETHTEIQHNAGDTVHAGFQQGINASASLSEPNLNVGTYQPAPPMWRVSFLSLLH
jgi:hypothetical protein